MILCELYVFIVIDIDFCLLSMIAMQSRALCFQYTTMKPVPMPLFNALTMFDEH
jgi:hypothetical protein